MTRTEGFEAARPFLEVAPNSPGMRIQVDNPASDPTRAKAALKRSQADLARLLLGLTGGTQPGFAVTYAYGGQAESPDGKADIIDVTGPFFGDPTSAGAARKLEVGRASGFDDGVLGGDGGNREDLTRRREAHDDARRGLVYCGTRRPASVASPAVRPASRVERIALPEERAIDRIAHTRARSSGRAILSTRPALCAARPHQTVFFVRHRGLRAFVSSLLR